MKKIPPFIPLILISLLTATLSLTACNDQSTDKTTKPALSLLDQGNQYWADKKLDLAEKTFKQAINANPDSSKAHARLADLLLSQNKTAEAIPEYQTAITLDPENPRLFAAISIAYLHQSKYSMAQVMANEALRLDPKMEQAKKLSSYIETKQQMLQQAHTHQSAETATH